MAEEKAESADMKSRESKPNRRVIGIIILILGLLAIFTLSLFLVYRATHDVWRLIDTIGLVASILTIIGLIIAIRGVVLTKKQVEIAQEDIRKISLTMKSWDAVLGRVTKAMYECRKRAATGEKVWIRFLALTPSHGNISASFKAYEEYRAELIECAWDSKVDLNIICLKEEELDNFYAGYVSPKLNAHVVTLGYYDARLLFAELDRTQQEGRETKICHMPRNELETFHIFVSPNEAVFFLPCFVPRSGNPESALEHTRDAEIGENCRLPGKELKEKGRLQLEELRQERANLEIPEIVSMMATETSESSMIISLKERMEERWR